jgi:hypothetical protein
MPEKIGSFIDLQMLIKCDHCIEFDLGILLHSNSKCLEVAVLCTFTFNFNYLQIEIFPYNGVGTE